MTDGSDTAPLRGVTFAKQFPNPAEPLRGLFVAEQVLATRQAVEWRVIAPVPFAPRALARLLHKPYVKGDGELEGIPVYRPRYAVLPRRLAYSSVAPSVAAAARSTFQRVVAEHRPQFVHAHALYPSAAAVRRLAGDAGIPYVVTIHGSDLYSNLAHRSWRRELVAAAAGAARVVCVSSSLERDTRRELELPAERTIVVPDTYDEASFRYVPRARDGGGVRLVTVGRLVDVKGHALLLDAMSELVRGGLNATLEIVGDGPLASRLAETIAAKRLGGRVRLRGPLASADLLEALGRADLFVLPSLREGFGVALVEGMATGLPAVATRSGGPDDIVTPESGVLVGPGDASALAAGIAEAVARLAEFDGRAIAEDTSSRFGAARLVSALVPVYRDAAAEGGR